MSLQLPLFSKINEAPQTKGWFSSALQTLDIKENSEWPDIFGKKIHQWNQNNTESRITAISLFSGGGGLDIGFHDAGFDIIECNEIESNFAATLQRNSAKGGYLEGSKIVCQDIHQYIPSVKNVDFIIGGPPCQTFSAAGARAAGVNGTDDVRGNLFLQYARLVDLLQPQGFLFENVYRIVGAQSGKPWQQIQDTFLSLGYKLYWRILDAADYGVPQFRERLIIVGLKNGSFQFPFPSHGPDSPDERGYYNAGQAIQSLDTSYCKVGINGRHGHLLNDIPPGLNYSFYTERMGHPKPLFGWRSKFSDYLYKADPETPVRTIKAQGGQYTGPFSWENRPFTIEELKRLQTFPDEYILEGNRQTIIHQLGNSVPPQMARILALSILDQIFNVPIPLELSLMPDHYQLGFRKRKSDLTSVYAKKAAKALSNLPLPKPYFVDIQGMDYISLTNDFQVNSGLKKDVADYVIRFNLTSNEWIIELCDVKDDFETAGYEIKIEPPFNESQKPLATNLISYCAEEKSLLALWKVYELFVKKHLFKDDLVQLFGYYQYKSAYSMQTSLLNKKLQNNHFWLTVQKVTSGNGVGSILPAHQLAYLYNLPSTEELFQYLVKMKDIGYEIRNHRTNKQISDGMILIPYSFPTLNERSLQRLTRL